MLVFEQHLLVQKEENMNATLETLNHLTDADYPASYFLAFDGDALVGVSELHRAERADTLRTGLTGVRPPWRRKGVAQALKVKAAEYAKKHGATTSDTENHLTNRPMLQINEAMGFVKQPAWLCLEKDL